MFRAHLASAVKAALAEAVEAGELHVPVTQHVMVEPARRDRHGDYTSNVALRLAGQRPSDAMRVGAAVAARLTGQPSVAEATVVPPGFVNIVLTPAALAGIAATVVQQGKTYGSGPRLAGRRVQLSYPPVSVLDEPASATRATVIGQVLRCLLENAGATVQSEGGAGQVDLRLCIRTDAEPERPADLAEAAEVVTVRPAEDEGGSSSGLTDAMRYAMVRTPLGQPVLPPVVGDTPGGCSEALVAVQYAGARAASLLRHASALGMGHAPADPTSAPVWDPVDRRLLLQLAEFPHVLDVAEQRREPRLLPRYLEGVAATLDRFFAASRILPRGDEPVSPSMNARLSACLAARITVTKGLGMLGLPAPERM